MNLQLSLKKTWWDMSDTPDGKTEDYREITEYWCRRLFDHKNCKLTIEEISRYLNNYKYYGYVDINTIFTYHKLQYNYFMINTMTLGYPKKDDTSRFKVFEHAGIEIRTGNTEWGAEPNKLYFVIKHGKRIQ